MATSSARMTVGALFGTITNAANAVSSTLDSVTKGVSMVEVFVDNAATEQRERTAVDSVGRLQRIIAEKALEMSQRSEQIAKYTSQSDFHKDAYDHNVSLIMSALEARKKGASTTEFSLA